MHKDYVIDYTSALRNVIMETESGVGGLTYRNVYGLQKVETVIYGIPNGTGSVMQYVYDDLTGELVLTATDPGKEVIKNNIVKLYFHQDHLGTTDYLTDNVTGKVTSYVTYDDWGALTAKAILKMGVRELDLVQDYTGHPADMVLGVFYAKARMYDAQDRRFMAVDPVKGVVTNPQTMVQYTYVVDNPIIWTDPLGLVPDNELGTVYLPRYRMLGGNANRFASMEIAEQIYTKTPANLAGHQIAQLVIADRLLSMGIIPRVEFGIKTDINSTIQIDILAQVGSSSTIIEVKSDYDIAVNGPGEAYRGISNYYNNLIADRNENLRSSNNIKSVVLPSNAVVPISVIPNITLVDNEYFSMHMNVYNWGGGLFSYELVKKDKRKNQEEVLNAYAAQYYAMREFTGYYRALYELETYILQSYTTAAIIGTAGLCLEVAAFAGASLASLPLLSAYLEGLGIGVTEAAGKAVVIDFAKEAAKKAAAEAAKKAAAEAGKSLPWVSGY